MNDKSTCEIDGCQASCPENSSCKQSRELKTHKSSNSFQDGSWVCQCNDGYSENYQICSDNDECLIGSHECDNEKSSCSNTDGSYSCDCFPGYQKINSTCEDINECVNFLHKCPTDSICKNTNGRYSCLCRDGTILQSGRNTKKLIKTGPGISQKDANKCPDTDECMDGTHKCSENNKEAKCLNRVGGYTCQCSSGND